MTKFIPLFFFISSLFFVFSCGQGKSQEQATKSAKTTTGNQQHEAPLTEVKAIEIQKQTFNRELFANGKLQAIRKANLNFQGNGMIQSISMAEGQRVGSGQVLGILDKVQQERDYKQAQLRLSQSQLDYQDQLLRAGYQLKDTASLSADIIRIARLRSGLSAAEFDIQRTQDELQNSVLKAPFGGQIANLKAKPHNRSGSYDFVCTLIDDSELEVEFQVLEQELDFIKSSQSVRIQSFSKGEHQFSGRITSINPLIDQAGMITVKAKIANSGHQLMDGMSVRVVIEKTIHDQLVIPKEAVLDRQNRKVVFTAENGIAKWNYVEIAFENSSQYAIEKGLNPGHKVIYEGNFNLAHDKPIREISN